MNTLLQVALPARSRLITALIGLAFSASAFALTPGSGTWVKETATYGPPNLPDAYVYVPKNTAPSVLAGKRALMLSLPGCGQSSANIINKGFNWETTAEQYGMVVIASSIPSGGSRSSGCWDWVGDQTRTGRDVKPLIDLVNAVKGRTNLDIDPNQVYVSGLSSGAAQTHIMGCAYPDVFAAVIPNAGPALGGTSTSIFSDPTITAQQVVDNCKKYNGNNYNSYFNTQLFVNVYGSGDTTVKPSHNVRNRDGMKILYGATTSGGTVTVSGGGTVDLWKDANGKFRIGNQVVQGMGHAWPAGSGGSGGGTYVDYTHVNFPAYIVPWLFNNNLRVNGTTTTTSTAGGTTTTTVAGTTTTTLTPPPGSGFTYHMVQAASGTGSAQRNFDYYVPTNYVPGTPSPLYVVLHGCRITDRTMTDLVGFQQYAERDRAIILYPFQNNDASSNDNDGRNPNCWGYWMSGNVHRGAGEVGDIKRMVDYMKGNFNIDNNRVHITGISSGGAMTTIAQVAYPDVFASSVIIEGVGYAETTSTYTGTSDCQLVINYGLGSVRSTASVITDMRTEMQKSVLRQAPVLVMHNKKDCTVPIKVGQSIVDAFLGLRGADGLGISSTPTSSVNGSVDGMPYTWNKYGNDGSGNSLVESVILDVTEAQVLAAGVQVINTDPWDPSGSSDNAVKEDTKRGHWWPGSAQRGPWLINKGINANQVAADFFKAHPMSGAGSTTTTTTSTAGGTTSTTTATTTTTTVAASCYTSSNYAHVTAGRAYHSLGYVYANGSAQNMGLYNTYTTKTLKKTGTNYYVIGTCP